MPADSLIFSSCSMEERRTGDEVGCLRDSVRENVGGGEADRGIRAGVDGGMERLVAIIWNTLVHHCLTLTITSFHSASTSAWSVQGGPTGRGEARWRDG